MDTQLSTTTSAGTMANEYATEHIFADFNSRKASNTRSAYHADLSAFAAFLNTVGIVVTAEDLQANPTAWQPVTWGLVAAFVRWQLQGSAATGSIARRLACIKRYARLAQQAGAVDATEALKIAAVDGYSGREAKEIDQARTQTGTAVRQSTKKAQAVTLTVDQAKSLKTQPDTPQGRRDALLMCLLLDHGLRAGEVAGLEVTAIDLDAKTLHFYREKVGKVQTHRLTADTLRAARAWLETDAHALGPLFRGSRKGGSLTDASMTRVSISERVRTLGSTIGIENLSAHDCRHYWATRAASKGTPMQALRDAGGWSSLAMPNRYIEAQVISNDGVLL